ncbi:ferredoxin-type protein NapG [Thermovibrio guaymasensis]|uniref:Ferredoxin-type protein NapG n=1 Tax=Thermovibrio guaymasensis TaxID=240167 RepID=A0A420W5V4_9BACT|nr:4Fe-4S dicluster domain-containing protein [Thermovibrio guaymasensis]RKQ60429.1 ferredoxin-type protein NapG [Thermovibrio guaymasensis]
MSRRSFFKLLGKSIAQAAAEFTYEATKPNRVYLRPPGSGEEDEFLKLCTKCKTCISACPTGVLETVKEMHPVVFETPVMNFDNNYCERCYSCIEACKSGALKKENLEKYRVYAKLIVQRCVAYQDVFCQSCYWSCPKIDKAITLKDFAYPEFNSQECTGCGRCIHACPTNPKAIELVKEKNEDKGSGSSQERD